MSDEGAVGHGVTAKSTCCSCTADWAKKDTKDEHATKKWWAVVPLVIINIITVLLGICFLGVSAYVTATFESWQQYISWTGLLVCVFLSLFVIALGFLGCCGAINRSMLMLTIYLFCLFILSFVVLGVAAVVLVYGGTICGGHAMDADTCAANAGSREVSNALIKIQTECCQTKQVVPLCTKETGKSLYQCMYPECDGNNEDYCVKAFSPCTLGMAKKYPAITCERKFPPPMTKTPDAMCIGVKTLIFKDRPAVDGLTPAQLKETLLNASIWKNHDETICQKDFNPLFAADKYKENKVAGCGKTVTADPAATTCYTNARIAWSKQVAAYFEDNMKNFGMGLVILAAFLIVMMFLAFCSCCQNKSHLDAKSNNDLTHDARA